MLDAIAGAEEEVLLEMYIFTSGAIGQRFREALVQARGRGVRVLVLLDAFGSMLLPSTFWNPLIEAGGSFRWFNPFSAGERYGSRNHRKLLVVDRCLAIIGGFNVANAYYGDGARRGWRDLGMQLAGPMVAPLADSFHAQYHSAEVRPPSYMPLHRNSLDEEIQGDRWRLLFSGPGRGHSALKRSLVTDLWSARKVQIICAYFLPTWRLRRALMRVVRQGGEVELILAGKSDILTARLACRSLYSKLMRAGVKIYEYEPQVLHAKLFIIDDIAYVGSANLDARSLQLNHELLLRVCDKSVAEQGKDLFSDDLKRSRRITPAAWKMSRNWFRILVEKAAYFLLARIDPYITSLRWRRRAVRAFNPKLPKGKPDEIARNAEAR